ncbi:MAG: tRNA (guanosine(37)-N1)-methyltransferase TrmD [bacterium]
MMQIFVVTAFPKFLDVPLHESIVKRAQEKNIVAIHSVDLRDFTNDKHKQVDDYPYGGGPGMILKPEPFFQAVEHLCDTYGLKKPRIVLMTPQGRRYNQEIALEYSEIDELILLCGHYKGVDERVREYLANDEISIGDYILTGGELAAMIIVDSVVRLLPGVIGDLNSAKTDSFAQSLLDYPHYTRPENLNGMQVPDILLSGHHAEIDKWRREKAVQRTKQRRSDLLEVNPEFEKNQVEV